MLMLSIWEGFSIGISLGDSFFRKNNYEDILINSRYGKACNFSHLSFLETLVGDWDEVVGIENNLLPLSFQVFDWDPYNKDKLTREKRIHLRFNKEMKTWRKGLPDRFYVRADEK